MKRSPIFFFNVALIAVVLFLSGCGISIKQTTSSDGGIFVSEDGGETWLQRGFIRQEKKKAVTIYDVSANFISFDPNDSSTIYIGTKERGVFISHDRGETWAPTGLATGSATNIGLDPTNTKIAYSVAGASILKSIDGLQTWTVSFSERAGVTVNTVTVDSSETNRVLAGTSAGAILLSEDFGTTWRVLTTLPDAVRQLISVPNRPKALYAVTIVSGIHKSTDGGITWKNISPDAIKYPAAVPPNWFSVHPKRPDELAIASTYGVLVSRDGGQAWQAIPSVIPFSTVPIQTIQVSLNDPQTIYFTVGNRLYKTSDGGQTWRTLQSIPTARPITVLTIDPERPATIYVGTLRVKK